MSTAIVSEAPIRRRVEQVMGLPFSLALRGRHAQDQLADAAWDQAVAVLREADRVFSTYRADSVISRLGRGEIGLDQCPPEVAEVLAIAEAARQESDGAFDIRRPSEDGARLLDPSGVVKGWAIDRAVRAFEHLEQTDVCLAGGGDMVCRTRAPGSAGWRVGIEDPFDASRVIAVVPVRNGAVATSGSAHRGDHIVDPRDGTVPRSIASVTVVGESLTWVDIEATTAFVLGEDALAWLSARPGRSGLVVRRTGEVRTFGPGS